ncbi:MAG: archease [Candidatus Pacearchaeota archaeon]|nr:archease [Candidatus Pacearchaeota archaeon]
MKKYEFLEHSSEIKFRIFGKTISKIFENTSLAISEILSGAEKVEDKAKKKIELEGKDNESLLYDFIDELIYLLDAEHFLVSKAKVEVKEGKLNAIIYGDDALRYPKLDYIKAATYSEMYIREKNGNWEAQVVVDV